MTITKPDNTGKGLLQRIIANRNFRKVMRQIDPPADYRGEKLYWYRIDLSAAAKYLASQK